MSDSNSEIGAIFDILKKNLEIKDEVKKIIKYSISEKLLCSLFFNFIKNRVGSQDFQLLTILSFFKEQAENMANEAGETDDRAFYTEMVDNFKILKEKLKDINSLAFYQK